jgi:hypothetical protein
MNSDRTKPGILKDNKGKSGIYRGVNKEAGKVMLSVKEQRVDGSRYGVNIPYLRYTLTAFEINYRVKIPSNQINKVRSYSSTTTQLQIKLNLASGVIKMNPWFLTGFTDAEGSFSLSIRFNAKYASKWKVQYIFSIGLHKKDTAILENIQFTLGVGKIYKQGKDSLVQFRVESIKDLLVVIEHFNKYPLITKKWVDFELFKLAVLLIKNKEHLTKEGLNKLISIRASMNKGLTGELKAGFPGTTPINKPNMETNLIRDPSLRDPHYHDNVGQWFVGFTSGEGCFSVIINKSQSVKTGYQVQLRFQLTQHIRDEQLMKNLMGYLGCGNVSINRGAIYFQVTTPPFFRFN